jgi:hypothetical protein
MGIWKTDNSTHEHFHISKEAAKEQRKAAAEARRAEEAKTEAAWAQSSAMAEAERIRAKSEKEARQHEAEMTLLKTDPEAYKEYLKNKYATRNALIDMMTGKTMIDLLGGRRNYLIVLAIAAALMFLLQFISK